MTLLREDSEFHVAIQNAARDLGDLDPSFVEKDYWVTQVLRALHVEYPGGFVFKGGTSLSKGHGIIERFSEDVDILVVPLAHASIRDSENHLRAMTAAVAAFLELTWSEGRSPGHGRQASRGDLIEYEARIDAITRVGIGPGSILLETGYGGGHEPSSMVSIEPMMCAPLGIDPDDHEDTKSFSIRALEPHRTLIEKLFAVHHIATLFETGDRRDQERFGRHFYDIYKLLEHKPTLRALEKRADLEVLIEDVQRLSELHFGGTTPRPEKGFAASPAFEHDRVGELRVWLSDKYTTAQALLPGTAEPPSFGAIMQRVNERRGLL